ncbi:DUF6888 family protein [Kamptonema animale]|uniref:DUF6888 family protein n=1 Tax=Kamptonema animale TaxID=92934 RepID=UPI003A91D965
MNPTNEQAQICLRLCQWLSNGFKDIQLFRFDYQTGDVYIFAGDELQIIVPPSGLWYFL